MFNIFKRSASDGEFIPSDTRQNQSSKPIDEQVVRPFKIADLKRSAIVQAAIGMIERAYTGAEVRPESARLAFTPENLGMLGRKLAEEGEAVFLIEVVDGIRTLRPTFGHDVRGGPDPASWRYQVHLPGPSETRTLQNVDAAQVMHFRIGASNSMPWKGRSPLIQCYDTVRALRQIEGAMVNEAARPGGNVVSVPGLGPQGNEKLRPQFNAPPGGVVVIGSSPLRGNEARATVGRVGPDLPATLISYRDRLFGELAAALGVPAELVLAPNQGSASREGYRRWVYSGIEPVAKGVAREAMVKGEWPDFRLTFDSLEAADLRTKANAFKTFTEQGISQEVAAAICGISLQT